MYRVLLRPPAQRFLRKLRDKSLTARLVAAMRGLASQPRPPGCDKLVGPEDLYGILNSYPICATSAAVQYEVGTFIRSGVSLGGSALGLTFQYREEYLVGDDDYAAGYSRGPTIRPG